ncbi:MAG: GNAT family N-acetyltransferase [Deltaproteobacteria bacterium]|nr:GNAT family N-acetyltransferase [Deltaproteobacteria bacterium]
MVSSQAKELLELINKNRAYLRQHLGWLDQSQSLSDIDAFIQFTIKAAKAGTELCYGIHHHNNLVGLITLRITPDQEASFGYWLAENMQGKGIVTSSARSFMEFAKNNFQIQTFYFKCGTSNESSQKIPLRLGAKHLKKIEKAENLYGRWVDHDVFTLSLG